MSFGPLFTLRTRSRKTRPESAGDPWPATGGWNERRARSPAEPGPATPRRRASDKAPRDPGAR
jgi:hypothetical protein